MHLDPALVLASAIVGFLVGLTGAGGGALMTPMLVIFFGVTPSSAISSDLVAAAVMRPVGGAVHLNRRTPNLKMVGWLMLGSVPAAFFGALVLRGLGNTKSAQDEVSILLGSVLLLGASAMLLRRLVERRSTTLAAPTPPGQKTVVKPIPTVLIGLFGGLIVGITSVGAGSLMIVMLLMVYPGIAMSELVGTDLVQAVPLTLAAALGHFLFGQVHFGVTASLIVGSVPAVFVGALLSSRSPDRLLRPAITFVLLLSGLKLVGLGTAELGWVAGVAGAAVVVYLVYQVLWRRPRVAEVSAPGGTPSLSEVSG
ncbi:MAG TPA: sulfite exporter TauE/SafE family protein [Acidimicrobiales bacterium]|nr:sulfite exporter TauE/SafE family protein [Acidimicrobiales bacterium]